MIPHDLHHARNTNRSFAECIERVRILVSRGIGQDEAVRQALNERGVDPGPDLLKVVAELVNE